MKDPASIESQHETEDELDKVLVAISVSVLAVIANRLGALDGASVADVYASMPKDIDEIERILRDGLKALTETTETVFERMAAGNDAWGAKFYEAAGVTQKQYAENMVLKEILDDGINSALFDARKMVNTSVIGIVDANDVFTPIRDAYVQEIGNAAAQMAAGEVSGQQAIADTVRKLSNSGLRVQYPNSYERKITDKAGHIIRTEWVTREKPLTRELYSAVRMNTMGTYRTTMMEMRNEMGEEYGANGVEVSAHALCAEDHLPYQGNQYPINEWNDIQRSLSRPIETGYGCHHTVYRVIYGVGKAYSDKELAELRRMSDGNVTFTGLSGKELTMSRYDASQYQRKLETTIRSNKVNAKLYDGAGLKADAKAYRAKARQHTAEYKRICEEVGLTPMMERTRAYML